MLPQTHLLGGILVALALRAFTPLTPTDFAISALLSVLYDVDYLYAYFRRYGTASLAATWSASVKHTENDRTVLHRMKGVLLILPAAGVASLFGLKYGLIFVFTYALHMLMDYLHYKFNLRIKEGKRTVPISYEEIGVDIGLVAVILWDVFL